ncbi:hypothetical protein ACFWM0_14855 [Streptomyces sp. NPDC058405]|uniref:hypothetical protein n=1 Tax=Streptomyces sp. NPDC058405 TaxID=3346482 RepID=UPI003651D724
MTGDFLQIPNATVRDERLSHMARGILAELLSRPDGWEATADEMWRASTAKRGKESPGRRAFRSAFAELKEHGYLAAGRGLLEGGRHATILTLTDVPQAGTSVRPAESRKAPAQTDVPHGGTSGSATDVPTGGTSAPSAQTVVAAGRTDVPLSDVPHGGTSKEEDSEKNTGLKTTTSSPMAQTFDDDWSSLSDASLTPAVPSAQKDHYLEAFGAFWTNYPKKRAREEAKKAWIAAITRGADPQHIVTASQAYARERAGEDPKYTKYPATWLNKGCYDDEPEPVGKPHLRAVGDYQPWTNPANQDDYYGSL